MILLFHLVHGHHQIFVLLTQQQHFHLGILHGLVLSIGLTPDFDSLGPYQIFVLDLWDAWMLLQPILWSPPKILLAQYFLDNAD